MLKSVNLDRDIIGMTALYPTENQKEQFNFSMLNYNVQSLHSKQPLSVTVEKQKKRIQLFQVEIQSAKKSVNFQQSL